MVRFETSDGYIYLKRTPKLLALEETIIHILQDKFFASVPVIIGRNVELSCFLMKDSGRPLREILKQKFNAELLCKAIGQFTLLQSAIVDHVNIFIEMGVPDWRLDKFPDLYMKMLSQKGLLIADGLSESEISELNALLPKVQRLCEKLSNYAIKHSIVQPDFHDNNLLIAEPSQKITFIDLGEIVISHPFFSLLTCLQQIKKHHALTDENEMYLKVKDACFKHYTDSESKENLSELLSIARILHLLYGALCGHRLMLACGKTRLMEFQPGKLSDSLKEFMVACIAIEGSIS